MHHFTLDFSAYCACHKKLSPDQREVLEKFKLGYTDTEIANALGIRDVAAVRKTFSRIYKIFYLKDLDQQRNRLKHLLHRYEFDRIEREYQQAQQWISSLKKEEPLAAMY